MIRKYITFDQEAVIEVWLASSVVAHPFINEEVWKSHTDDLRKKYLPTADTWLWEDGGKIVGFISLIGNYIGGLFILPEWQGKGIGSQLIRLAQKERGSLTVGVYAKNKKAREFYIKCGFFYESEEVQQETGEIVVTMKNTV